MNVTYYIERTGSLWWNFPFSRKKARFGRTPAVFSPVPLPICNT
jgi:hypothetical protein